MIATRLALNTINFYLVKKNMSSFLLLDIFLWSSVINVFLVY